jgi:hypothetical protein
LAEHIKMLETSAFTAFVADNAAAGIHREGYNGIASLVPKATGNNIFVPVYCGLNYECTWLEGVEQTYEETFEPRRRAMEIAAADAGSVTLYQGETAFKGIEAEITFRVEEPWYLHQRVRIAFHKALAKGRRFTSLWASYLHAAPNRNVYLKRGGGDLEGWIGVTKERHRAPYYMVHDLPARELSVAEHATLAQEPPAPPRFEAIDEPLAFYYGLYFDLAFISMFKDPANTRLAYSPNGGDEAPPWSPAWDYMLNVDSVELERPYEWNLCVAVKPFAGRRDVLDEARRYAK